MFSKIRRRLTFLYSGIMGIFLLTFVIVAFTGLSWALYWKEKQEVLRYVGEEAREHSIILKHPHLLEEPAEEKVAQAGSGVMFFYVFDNAGELVALEAPHQSVKRIIMDKIKSWDVPDGQVVTLNIDIPNGDAAIWMMAALPVIDDGERLGKVYVGRDITSYHHMLKTLVAVLSGVSFIFLLIASGGGYIMAGRAIVPIKKSYDRQREFVADASHELRTPLSVLMASVDAIQGDRDNFMSSFTTQVLDDMKDELRKMTKIVGDMLTLARTDATAISVLKEKFDLTPVVEQVVRSLQPLAKEKDIQLRFEKHGEFPVIADKERIKQLLLILMDNGIKYTPANGVVQAAVELNTETQEVRIIVKDSGVGIPPELHDLIFERFYRADKTRSRESGGSGLGLAIAKWIVVAHGGAIQVSSKEGQGAVFSVVLPQ